MTVSFILFNIKYIPIMYKKLTAALLYSFPVKFINSIQEEMEQFFFPANKKNPNWFYKMSLKTWPGRLLTPALSGLTSSAECQQRGGGRVDGGLPGQERPLTIHYAESLVIYREDSNPAFWTLRPQAVLSVSGGFALLVPFFLPDVSRSRVRGGEVFDLFLSATKTRRSPRPFV